MDQPLLPEFDTTETLTNEIIRQQFSHDDECPQEERRMLESRYSAYLEETSEFNRQLVSFQANKKKILHSWMRYKEGFSSKLVEILLSKFGIQRGDTVLDPFVGSGTTLLVANSLGINSVGIELLRNCHLALEAKSKIFDFDVNELKAVHNLLSSTEPSEKPDKTFSHLRITESAFSERTEREIMFFDDWISHQRVSENSKLLFKLAITSILEGVSYTRKDGQYLRWDYRSQKVQARNEIRRSQGKKLIKKFDKGELPSVKELLIKTFWGMVSDIEKYQQLSLPESSLELINGNTLLVLPTLESNTFSSVITSPPYCNRYDYTRTYALELAYLGVDEDGIRDLRQGLLSATVESKSKVNLLQDYYRSIDREGDYEKFLNIVQRNKAFNEINSALRHRWDIGHMNNRGVLRMVEHYFTELTFVFAELFRVCKKGAHVAFVNDNVRYGGEVIPVDTLSTELANELGFEPVKILVLQTRKGNSSQQMMRFDRTPLRKSITFWKKP